MLHRAGDLFLYGEVLQAENTREKDYAKYLAVTASHYGKTLRSQVKSDSLSAKYLKNWRNEASGDRLVTWVESHDTYANEGKSAKLTNFQLRAGWAVIAARKEGTPLFFSRPKGAEGLQFPGASKIGDAGNDEFKNPEVIAVNKFRTAMRGEEENLFNADEDGGSKILCIERGKKGLVIINTGDAVKFKAVTSLPDGVYTDRAHGMQFKIKKGVISSKLNAREIYVIY